MGLLKKAEEIIARKERENEDIQTLSDYDLDIINDQSDDNSFENDYDSDEDDFFGENEKVNEINLNDDVFMTESSSSISDNDEDFISSDAMDEIDSDISVFPDSADPVDTLEFDDASDLNEDEFSDDNSGFQDQNDSKEQFSGNDSDAFSAAGRVIPDKDAVILYEISKEIIRCITNEELYESLIFVLMGQLGAGCSSILVPGKETDKWQLKFSRGVQLQSRTITFKETDKILRTLIEKNKILLLDEYSRDTECREEFLKFQSIDGHIICPVSFNKKVKFAIVMGEKLTIGNYSAEDSVFIESICETAGVVAERINILETLREENGILKKKEKTLEHLDVYEEKIRVSESENEIHKIINSEMNEFGVQSYAFFFKDELLDRFGIRYNEHEDFIGLVENGFSIDINNAFTAYLLQNISFKEIENPVNSEILKNIFSSSHLTRINIFAAYPYVINSVLTGFVVIFRADVEKFRFNKIQIQRFSKTLFMNYFSRCGVKSGSDSYVDNYSYEIKRIQNTIKESASLDIPVGFAMFGVKNLRRFQQEYGEAKTIGLLKQFSDLIRSKLSKTDYIIRFSYNKFLFVMPGRSKKSSVTFCNAMKNEIAGLSKNYDFQFLVTFIHAEYPEDGKNIFSILDVLD
ncbi:MAG: diguanylate cyclase [Spirochaetes bacterium]|nr:diguanylate cyclase [Spirochaetota bacterium]